MSLSTWSHAKKDGHCRHRSRVPCMVQLSTAGTIFIISQRTFHATSKLRPLFLRLSFRLEMGLYGKYTRTVNAFSIIQMMSGLSMIGLAIALRIFVCSWITDAAFGFWIGLWVFIGGLIGHCSTTKNIYGLIGYFLGFNSLGVMFTSVVILCHSLAWVHFNMQMKTITVDSSDIIYTNMTRNYSSSLNYNSTNSSSRITSMIAYPVTVLYPTTVVHPTYSIILNHTNISTPSLSSVGIQTTTPIPENTTDTATRDCYTHQTWSNYENGKRGVGLGAGMIFACVVQIVMAVLSSGYCWAAVNVKPTNVVRCKAVAQGTYSEAISARNVRQVVEPPIIVEYNGQEQQPETADTPPGGVAENQYDDIPAANTEQRRMNIYDTVGGAMEMTPVETYQNLQETKAGGSTDDPPCPSSTFHPSVPPFIPFLYAAPSAPYAESETTM